MTTNTTTTTTTAIDVAVDLVDRDPGNRQPVIDLAFATSIARHGVLIPIIITATDHGRYRLVAGERRVEAARQAGQTTVPAVVRDIDDITAGVYQIVENVHRRSLSPSEEAGACARLLGAGMTRKALATELGRPASWVKARLALAGLPTCIRDAVDSETLEPSVALILAPHADDDELLDAVLTNAHRSGQNLTWFIDRFVAQRAAAAESEALLVSLAEQGITPTEANDLPKRAHQLRDLDLAEADHRDEPCHAITVVNNWDSTTSVVAWCTDPKRHRPTGTSDLASDALIVDDDSRAIERDERRRQRETRQHLDDFARSAINARLRPRDITNVVLPILFDHLGQTELNDAARFFGDIEPDTSTGSTNKDYVTPLRAWAAESPANLTRTLLAVVHVLGRDAQHGLWRRPHTADLWQAWLDQLGYQPPA